MKKLTVLLAAFISLGLSASEAEHFYPNDELPELNGDRLIIAQQHGFQVFMNNCSGCHSLGFQRYNRTAKDLKIPQDVLLQNLMFTGDKVGELMQNAMDSKKAKKWFGAAPPDLSVVSRARGTHWLYNYLRGFYADDSRPYGVNNSVFPNVGMPHALQRLQGLQVKSRDVLTLENDIEHARGAMASAEAEMNAGKHSPELEKQFDEAEHVIHESEAKIAALAEEGKYFDLLEKGELDKASFDKSMADLVHFLDYIGEPAKQIRTGMGRYVLLFILLFGVFAYFLKKEYWKDVH